MVGVTLFGIFLTPVFFHVIQGLGDAPVFHSARAQRLGFAVWVLLNIALLGLPILLMQLRGRAARQHPAHAPALPLPQDGPPDTRGR
jgi:multidrug efflux pump